MTYIRGIIERAKSQDFDAAKTLIKEFCETVNQNRQHSTDGTYRRDDEGKRIPLNTFSGIHTHFDEELLDYFVECFEKIGEIVGVSELPKPVTADVALNLAAFGSRGPKAKLRTREKSLARGLEVWKAHRDSKNSIETTCADLAQKLNQSEHTLARDYKLFIKALE